MSHDLPKSYEPGAIEARWADYWVKQKLFHVPTPAPGDARPRFSLLLPPPNVTGRLHMGHMLNQTQMDIIVRWHRMRDAANNSLPKHPNDTTLWLPGTDHAGIATQMMVERQLATEKKKRQDLGREAFVERVWEWKRLYGSAIQNQMKRLGASVDWDREYFTMDDHLSRAVREAFVRLYEDGLIYRGKYIVNWCPRCGTAISDLEVRHEEIPGKLYEIRYPVIGSDEFITVATTRPETMLGDTAVAVNQKDDRYKHLHGKKVKLPLMNREIPVITDEIAQPEFGTGAVKITPSHDPNDFEAGLRHNLPQIDVMDERGNMNQNAGAYAGLDRYAAREKVLEDLRLQGYLAGEKDYTISIAKCDRCGTIVEPRLSMQWFIKIEPLAKRAIEVVEKDFIRFTPENYKQIYLNWMYNIHDWCISRQLWWGHRIPAWACRDCNHLIVARETPSTCPKCSGSRLEQESDVLDTWFSSGLLPFTALGWPEATPDLAAFYPTSLLITGFDILFFWVARMIMLGCWFMVPPPSLRGGKELSSSDLLRDSVPFREVYIHALVRDADRQKMSKTKGNVLDPIEVIEKYGTDATRFTLASMSSPGTDIAFNPSRTEGYRAFANKIWNAARFMFMNVDRIGISPRGARDYSEAGISGFEAASVEDRWILSRFNRVAGEVAKALEIYRFDDASRTIYDFFWGELCDWYLELIKPRLLSENEADRDAVRQTCGNLVSLFEASLRLLHPIMPFITEEIWQAIYDGKPYTESIALAPYPNTSEAEIDIAAEREMLIIQDLVVHIRNNRAELKVPLRTKVTMVFYSHDSQIEGLVRRNRGAVERLAGLDLVHFPGSPFVDTLGAIRTAIFDFLLIYNKKVDLAVEHEKLVKELAKLENEKNNGERQLADAGFLNNAPSHVISQRKKRVEELKLLIEKHKDQARRLGVPSSRD